jgi:hypothetical protein
MSQRRPTGDGSEETLAVPERHAELLEVDLRQVRQDIGVDFTRAKERLVLSEAEWSEPTPDIHGRTPRAQTDHPSVEALCPGPGCLQNGHHDPPALPVSRSVSPHKAPVPLLVLSLRQTIHCVVMAGLVPAIHDLQHSLAVPSMPGTGMTTENHLIKSVH